VFASYDASTVRQFELRHNPGVAFERQPELTVQVVARPEDASRPEEAAGAVVDSQATCWDLSIMHLKPHKGGLAARLSCRQRGREAAAPTSVSR
jgi:hypothetical protein